MPITEQDKERVKALTPLSTVLARYNKKSVAACPSCGSTLQYDDARGVWLCHGCDAGGDVFGLVMAAEGVGFAQAVALLDGWYGNSTGQPGTP